MIPMLVPRLVAEMWQATCRDAGSSARKKQRSFRQETVGERLTCTAEECHEFS